jgi:hypothetical protein
MRSATTLPGVRPSWALGLKAGSSVRLSMPTARDFVPWRFSAAGPRSVDAIQRDNASHGLSQPVSVTATSPMAAP